MSEYADGYRFTFIETPKLSDWHCYLFGHENGVTYRPVEGQEPNWFHRKMQEYVFGFRWEYKPPT